MYNYFLLGRIMPRHLRILSIDDDAITQQQVVDFLTENQHDVSIAHTGDEGLTIFSRTNPEIILCDVNMRNKRGQNVLSVIHAQKPDIPIIAISAASCIHDAVEALRQGAWDYIIKPISDTGSLTHAINKCLERCKLILENDRYKERLEKANKELTQNLATLEEDQEAGRCVQFQLLPESAQDIRDFKMSHFIMPSLYLSGDFVDYFPIDDHKIGFYIADVSGHGAPSAFITVLLKSLVNQFVVRYGAQTNDMIVNPAKLLNWLSLDILRAKLGKYLTMIYGVIDEKKNEMVYSVGGHFPNPILIVDNQAKYLTGSGFPVGVFDKAKYENYTLALPEKFNLFMCSDGILELLPHDDLEAKEAYLVSLVSKDSIDLEEIIQAIEIEKYRAIPDDVTLLLIKKGVPNGR